VCRAWRSEAEECDDIRLLYRAGRDEADQSFQLWLSRQGRRVKALTLTRSHDILNTLADAADAATKAGRPLPLHTLRVLWSGPDVATTGRLLAHLPHLHTLQLSAGEGELDKKGLRSLASLKRATQLQELYIDGAQYHWFGDSVAKLLPASLKRLSWKGNEAGELPDLSHLTQLSFLHLFRWQQQETAFSDKLPPGLQELQLSIVDTFLGYMKEESNILTRYDFTPWYEVTVDWLQVVPNFKHVRVGICGETHVDAALRKLTHMSSLTVCARNHGPGGMGILKPLVSSPTTYSNLRSLELLVKELQDPCGVGALTQVTRLVVQSSSTSSDEQQRSWAAELGRMAGLRWLSVPAVLLVADQAWLGGLKQLQVLVVSNEMWGSLMYPSPPEVLPQVVEGLEGCSPQALPPRLLLLGFSSMSAEQAAALQVRRRLRHALSSSGCEVVVGVDLDEVADPIKQLAGLPEALQQALALVGAGPA
jgi:hypothetical protein